MSDVRTIAFYLPQFYPNPENDLWWGKGFTEWTNVTRARPQFSGHYQPHLPADLGFYDLRLPEARQEQANLAREYGIHGFCYYHYWFHGERMLERVVEEVVESGKPDFPFCLCWANETWTKTWAGKDGEVLRKQRYSSADDLRHIRYLVSIFRDPRYIKVDGRPLFLIYRPSHIRDHLPGLLKTWKVELEKLGLPEPYLCAVRTPPDRHYQAGVDFFPREDVRPTFFEKVKFNLRKRLGVDVRRWRHRIVDYADLVDQEILRPRPSYKEFCCPVPGWDNTPRKARSGSFILHNSSPAEFRRWLDHCVQITLDEHHGDERILFINAWNEWAEGAHLEPDQKWGRAYLEAVRNSVLVTAKGRQ
jgi:lipopolysaccharide biosynthesis protein